MLYRLYKLRFNTPLRFGVDGRGGLEQVSPTARADTLFSALCTEAAALDESYPIRLITAVQTDVLKLTDLLPFNLESLYLPRPYLPPVPRHEQIDPASRTTTADRKRLKRQKFLSVAELSAYLAWLRHGGEFNSAGAHFGASSTETKVNRREDEALPYHVASFSFDKDCGLYFVAGATDGSLFTLIDTLIDSLGYSGIGGKRSAGYGKFEAYEDPIDMDRHGMYADDAALYNLLTDAKADWQLALSPLWPQATDISQLADAYYSIVGRSGFVNSPAYAPQAVKRHSIHMLSAGSCFKTRISGQMGDVSAGGAHSVYRYGKPLYAGVKL